MGVHFGPFLGQKGPFWALFWGSVWGLFWAFLAFFGHFLSFFFWQNRIQFYAVLAFFDQKGAFLGLFWGVSLGSLNWALFLNKGPIYGLLGALFSAILALLGGQSGVPD